MIFQCVVASVHIEKISFNFQAKTRVQFLPHPIDTVNTPPVKENLVPCKIFFSITSAMSNRIPRRAGSLRRKYQLRVLPNNAWAIRFLQYNPLRYP